MYYMGVSIGITLQKHPNGTFLATMQAVSSVTVATYYDYYC